ncbi:hypothetical protein Cni_G04988 [Canna indica]|uniref:Uncharacterized protein n=1 Tax=Canna indica TaxID=4628 RepID=A0AAQ3JWW1_9LILI|nr:hypothetical protein Cni_G04988 [Canna indica]
MSMAVLQSHDCLKNSQHLYAYGSRPRPLWKPHRKKCQSPPSSSPVSSPPVSPLPPPTKASRRGSARHSRPSPNQATKHVRTASESDGRRTSPSLQTDGTVFQGETHPRRPLVMEEVRILKRGDDLKRETSSVPDSTSEVEDSAFCSTIPLGSEPEIFRNGFGIVQNPVSPYAGPAYLVSPSPSSLPFPSFAFKKDVESTIKEVPPRGCFPSGAFVRLLSPR